MSEVQDAVRKRAIVVDRVFPAPRALVMEAWSSADHVKRWFSPIGCSVPEANVDFRVGGVFELLMRTPYGDSHLRGHFTEISPPDRLAMTATIYVGDEAKFIAHTTATFAAAGFGTRMTVRQEYELLDPAFITSIEGAPEGWRTTLDKLEHIVAHAQASAPRNVAHGMFRIDRTYAAKPEMVFHALSNPAAKAKWFGGNETYTELERYMDFRPGGRERLSGRWPSGMVSTFDATYFDIVANARIVYGYEMHLDERKISVSLATIELKATPSGTKITVTEQGAFLDGYEDCGSREQGTADLFDRLGASLTAS
jgi:uncharacterized protein YndB with AHSA1/START domain